MRLVLPPWRGLILFFAALLLCFAPLRAAKKVVSKKVTLRGCEPEYAGRSVEFFTRTDYITQQREVLASVQIAKDGKFEVELPLFETQLVMVDLGVYSCYMYMEPGQRYRIAFPPLRDTTESERLNP